MDKNILIKHDRLQNDLNALKEKSSRTEGKIESLKEELKRSGFDSVEKAVKWLEKAKKELIVLESGIQEKLDETEELMSLWGIQ